ncbi:MAG TPA: hypothetical protein VMU10_09695, partial [Desulfomonilia bacterium]|nr:hypothetical protein [Desulfomonilia bacterium]
AKSVLYYKFSELMLNCTSGNWPEEIDFDHDLINRNLGIGEFFYTPIYPEWTGFLYIARGNFQATEWIVQKMSDIGETYDNDWAKVIKFVMNTTFLLKFRKLQDSLSEAEAGIQFVGKTGFQVWLIHLYSIKSRIHIMMGDVSGATDSIVHAEEIKPKVTTAPQNVEEFVMSKFILNLYQLEETMKKADNITLSMHRTNTFKAGKEVMKIAKKYALIKVEALKLMGLYYWLIGKQRKAKQWWRKTISEGLRLNDRLELSRTYYEVGKRLLEPKSKHKELVGIKAEEYLEKARVMFEEMDLQWDLDELEKLKIQIGT